MSMHHEKELRRKNPLHYGQPFKCQTLEMTKHTQTICQKVANKLFEWVWPFYGVGA